MWNAVDARDPTTPLHHGSVKEIHTTRFHAARMEEDAVVEGRSKESVIMKKIS